MSPASSLPFVVPSAPLARIIGLIAAAQFGLFTRQQFLDAGGTRRQLDRWVESGRVELVLPGVYRIVGVAPSWGQRQLQHCLSGVGRASHRSAARLFGVDLAANAGPEISVAAGRNYRREGVRVHRSSDLELDTPIMVDGIPCTSPARTVLDLGGVWGVKRTEHAVDHLLDRKLVTWEDLKAVHITHARRGRRGSAVVGELVAERFGETDQADSVAERILLRELDHAGLLAGSELHLSIHRPDGSFVMETDIGWPGPKLAVMFDSKKFHASQWARDRDDEKRRQAGLLGWLVLPYRWRDLRRSPRTMVDEVRAGLRRLPPT